MNRKEKSDLILQAALKVFSKYGYNKTTIEDIAKELSMTKGNLYLYFKDKKDLYEKAVAFGLRRWQKSAHEAIDANADPATQIVQFAINGWLYLSKDIEMQNIIVNDPDVFPLFPEEDHYYKINIDSMNLLKELLNKGIRAKQIRSDLDIDYTTQLLYSIYVMFVIRTYVKPETSSIDKLIDTAREVILGGILVHKAVPQKKRK